MSWIRDHFVPVGGFAFVLAAVGGAVGLIIFVLLPAAQESHKNELRQAACVRVLECVDLGIERGSCNALFPDCEGTP